MTFKIVGDFDPQKVVCTGSFTKFLTTFCCLSKLAEDYALESILDDDAFLDTICTNQKSKSFLQRFQKIIGNQFTLRDICTYYTGLPYTFDVSKDELLKADNGLPFKHHSILSEAEFLFACEHLITPVYSNRCKFHYSEISIIFLGYLMELIYQEPMEAFYKKYILNAFHLKDSTFSRMRTSSVFIQDLSPRYDYPSIAILDHGYFCYSNGFYTSLAEAKDLLTQLIHTPIFALMTDLKHARAASLRMMNGLAVEMRQTEGDLIYGYEGLSFSGCIIWCYSTKYKQGYVSFTNDEEQAYVDLYEDQLNYKQFDVIPKHAQEIYQKFIHQGNAQFEQQLIPSEFRGDYHRVDINQSTLEMIFKVTEDEFTIRNPEFMNYKVVYARNAYRILNKDRTPGAKVGLLQTAKHRYMSFDGTLYQQL